MAVLEIVNVVFCAVFEYFIRIMEQVDFNIMVDMNLLVLSLEVLGIFMKVPL